jgi:hypothetical protein
LQFSHLPGTVASFLPIAAGFAVRAGVGGEIRVISEYFSQGLGQ